MGELLAQVVAVRGGVAQAPEGVQADDVERAPVHAVQGAGGVTDGTAEDGPNGGDDLGEEGVDEVGDALERSFATRTVQDRDAVVEGFAGQVSAGEQAQFAACDEDDVGAVAAQPLGPLGAVDEVRQHLLVRHLAGKRREPDLQADGRGVPGRGLDPVGVAACDADRGAVQVLGDDPHLPLDDPGVEAGAGAAAVGKGARVVVDALAAHGRRLQ